MSKPPPDRVPQWIQGAVLGGLIGGIADFALCRWVQQQISAAAVQHGMSGPIPSDFELLVWAIGAGALGVAIGVIAGACSTPLKGAGVGVLLASAVVVLLTMPLAGRTVHPFVAQPLLIFAGLFVVVGSVAGVFGGAVGQRSAEAAAAERVWHRLAAGLASAALCFTLSLTTLFAWQEFHRNPPNPAAQGDALALSGDLSYILSPEHFQAIQMGMTLTEVQTALDVGQTRYDRGAMDAKIGEGNVGLCRQTAQRLPAAGERWIHFQNAFGNDERMGQQVSVRMKDGLVAEKKFHQGTSP